MLNSNTRRTANCDRLFVAEEIAAAHTGNGCLAVTRPCAHLVWLLFGVCLHCFGCAAIRIAFANDGIDCASFDLVIARLCFTLRIIGRFFDVIRKCVSLLLKFNDRGFQLRHGCTDIWKLDDVRLGREAHLAKFGKRVFDALFWFEAFRKTGNDSTSQRDVTSFDRDACGSCECANDGQKRIGRQSRCFVGVRIDDGWSCHMKSLI